MNGFSYKSNSSQKHDEFPSFLRNTVVQGDVQEALKSFPDESIHLTFTSPPYYNARDYSIYQSYAEYLNFLESVFKEVHRITKEGRFFVLNTSPIIIPRISRAHASKRYPIPYDVHPLLVKIRQPVSSCCTARSRTLASGNNSFTSTTGRRSCHLTFHR